MLNDLSLRSPRRLSAAPVIVILSLSVFAGHSSGGSLTPPAGPVVATMKTLDLVEPRIPVSPTTTPGNAGALFVINQPGSYYLTGSITGVAGKSGIVITGGVSLDLNGFSMIGAPGSLDAVTTSGNFFISNSSVRNGTILNWGGQGVGALIDNGVVEDLRIHSCAAGGINAAGAYHTRISRCSVLSCGTEPTYPFGISSGFASIIEECSVRQTNGDGIVASTGASIRNCTSTSNTQDGFEINNQCTVRDCTATSNTGNGFDVSSASTVENCIAASNAHGIFAANSNTLRNNNLTSNTTAGLRCGNDCVVIGNTLDSNGPLGMLVESADSRIEDNNVTDGTTGIKVTSGGNFIARNTVSGATTAWDVVAGNVCLVVQGVSGAAILGSAGGVAPGSTDPNANFTY